MDDRLRQLERKGLAGDPEATEALLNAQRRMGMYDRCHFMIQPFQEILGAGGQRNRYCTFDFNFELHYIVAIHDRAFQCKIEFLSQPNVFTDDNNPIEWAKRSSLSEAPLHSVNFKPQYKLLVPVFISKGSSVFLNVEDRSLGSNGVTIEFHGIKTVVNGDV